MEKEPWTLTDNADHARWWSDYLELCERDHVEPCSQESAHEAGSVLWCCWCPRVKKIQEESLNTGKKKESAMSDPSPVAAAAVINTILKTMGDQVCRFIELGTDHHVKVLTLIPEEQRADVAMEFLGVGARQQEAVQEFFRVVILPEAREAFNKILVAKEVQDLCQGSKASDLTTQVETLSRKVAALEPRVAAQEPKKRRSDGPEPGEE